MGDTVIDDCRKKERDHVAAVECETNHLYKLAIQLEKAYQAALFHAEETEAALKGTSVAYESFVKNLEDSQNTFKKYIESHCTYEAQKYGSGTFAADAKIGCMIDLTQERLARLSRVSAAHPRKKKVVIETNSGPSISAPLCDALKNEASPSPPENLSLALPNMPAPDLLAWTFKAIHCSIDFNPRNAEKALQTPSPLFTQEGWEDFKSIMITIGVRNLKENFYSRIKGYLNDSNGWRASHTSLISSKTENDTYTWTVSMPVAVIFESGKESRTDLYTPTLLKVRRVSFEQNPFGLAIAEWKLKKNSK